MQLNEKVGRGNAKRRDGDVGKSDMKILEKRKKLMLWKCLATHIGGAVH